MISNKKALETLKFEVDEECHCGYILEEIHIAMNALEKQIRKKVIEDCMCPNCGADVTNQADNDYLFEHCYHCGQALDWGENDAKSENPTE